MAAELGVVLMLFLVGLGWSPSACGRSRRPIFSWGSVQLLGCCQPCWPAGHCAGVTLGAWPWWPNLGLAMSSHRRGRWPCWPSGNLGRTSTVRAC